MHFDNQEAVILHKVRFCYASSLFLIQANSNLISFSTSWKHLNLCPPNAAEPLFAPSGRFFYVMSGMPSLFFLPCLGLNPLRCSLSPGHPFTLKCLTASPSCQALTPFSGQCNFMSVVPFSATNIAASRQTHGPCCSLLGRSCCSKDAFIEQRHSFAQPSLLPPSVLCLSSSFPSFTVITS